MNHTHLYAPRFVLGIILGTIWLWALPVLAQQSSAGQQPPAQQPPAQAATPQPPQSSDQAAPTPEEKKDQEIQQKTGTSNDRIFWTMPNFLTVNAAEIPPLSAGQKFKVVARSAFDYFEYPWYGMLAGISQAEDSDKVYGQGLDGYGKRYALAFADGTIENFTVGAILPSILRQDPRYYQLGKGGFWHRVGYAASRILVTRSDSGNPEFNASEVVGSAMSASISTFGYHPHGDRNVGNAADVWGTEMGYDALTFAVKEFWPDIRRHFQKKKN